MPVYLVTYIVLFWLPALILSYIVYKSLPASLKKSFWVVNLIMAVNAVFVEYLFLYFDVWSFSQKTDPLLGLWLGPVPIEEFVFWFGATPLCLAIYLYYRKLFSVVRRK